MVDIFMRQAEEGDLEAIADLVEIVFGSRQPPKYLNWLLSDPENPGRLNSIVALAGDSIVGHTGYVRANYHTGTEMLSGVHIILWAVHPEFRGIGTELYMRALTNTDISLIYEGTAPAVRVYIKLGYTRPMVAFHYRSNFFMPRITEYLPGMRIKSFAITLAQYMLQKVKRFSARIITDPSITFKLYSLDAWYCAPPHDGVVTNCPSREQISWLQQCPSLESRVLTVYRGEIPLGVLFIYINRHHGTHATGRIVHLPNMGEDLRAWLSVLVHSESLFRELGCKSFTTYAGHPVFLKAVNMLGYCNDFKRPAWVLDPQKRLADRTWHLTYIEGDHGFRGV